MKPSGSNRQIEQLKEAGYTVRVTHYRIREEDIDMFTKSRRDPDFVRAIYPHFILRNRGWPPAARGGGTQVQVFLGNRVIAHGESICNPVDNFNRKIGTQIALGRAIHNLKPAGQRRMLRQQLLAEIEASEKEEDEAREKMLVLEKMAGGGDD